jgi:serine/threonine protein kinase
MRAGYRDCVQRDLTEDASTVEFTRLDGYLLRERIGEGGMGVVHRATDADGRVVAIKLLRPHVAGDSESRARFAREAQVLARVRGRHVAQVLDADVAAATPYLVTDFVAGPPLHEVVERDGPLDGADLADLAGDLADALCSIHGADVVHRDLKPGNVLLDDGIAVVIDFGIAQIADDTRMTMPGLVYGTPGYVAPEILHGSEITAAADIHSWAATVAYASTGRAPFGKGPLEAVAYRVLHEAPDLDGCPDWLLPVLELCFAKDPAERPSAPALLRWLETGEPPPERTIALSQAPASGVPVAHLGNGATTPLTGASVEPRRYDSDADEGYPPPPGREDDGDDRDDSDGEPYESYESYADDDAADETEERAPEPSWPVYHGPVKQHRVVTTLAFAVLAALATVVPLVAAGALTGWLVVSRTVDRSSRFLRRRRAARGRRGLDTVVAAAALPWHVLRAVLLTALTLPIAITGAGILVGVVVLFFYAGAITPRWDLVAGGVGLVVAALAWWGVEGEGVQHGSRRILSAVLRRRWVSVAAGAVLAVVALVLATVASIEPVQWWPLEQGPLPRLDWPG